MTRTAMAILGQEADARDAMQEALTVIWRQLPALRDPARFEAWSTRILVNACRKVARGRGRARVRETRIDPLLEGGFEPAVAGAFDEAVVRRRSLERAFDRLDVDARTLLVLHHLEERPLPALADVLGIPVGTVKSRLHARRDLERWSARIDDILRRRTAGTVGDPCRSLARRPTARRAGNRSFGGQRWSEYIDRWDPTMGADRGSRRGHLRGGRVRTDPAISADVVDAPRFRCPDPRFPDRVVSGSSCFFNRVPGRTCGGEGVRR